jgi:two-component system cell cycle response regulator
MGAHILVVEDTPHNLQLMTYLLEMHGHTVVAAVTGEQGLELARSVRPDLVVMDLQLPGIDGYQALKAIRSAPDLAGIPVIAVTSFAMVGDRDRALSAGFDHYLTKPIDPEAFTGEIEAFLPVDRRGLLRVAAGDPPAQHTDVAHGPNDHPAADILVLDDSLIDQTLLRSVLEPHGYRVRTAFTVEQAVSAATETAPDLVLSDVHVGGGSGVDLYSYLCSVPDLAVVPFAYITATADRMDPLVGDTMTPVIRRPIEPLALLDEVEALLRTRTGGTS